MNPNSPGQEEVARRAREIWERDGRPDGRDTEIWLEAERELRTPPENSPSNPRGRGNGNSQGGMTPADPVTHERTPERPSENTTTKSGKKRRRP